MIRILLFLFVLIYTPILYAQPDFQWARAMGGSSSINFSSAVDPNGNIFLTGKFNLTYDFDPGSGVFTLTSVGGDDCFIVKLDSLGTLIWAKSFGGSSHEIGRSIALDKSGNIYICGDFQSSPADFDPGTGIFNLNSSGGQDAFFLKLDPSGNFVWAKKVGSSAQDLPYGIYIDNSNNVVTTGGFYNPADFDPGPGVVTLNTSNGLLFVLKLDKDGNYIFAKNFGAATSGYGFDIICDKANNIYTVGSYTSAGDFDPGPDTFLLPHVHYEDVFIEKLDSSGNFLWARGFGGHNIDRAHAVTVDSFQNVYTTGFFSDTIDIDPGPNVLYFNPRLVSSGYYYDFLQKLDKNGNFQWANTFIPSGYSTSIDIDKYGNTYISGNFVDTIEMNACNDSIAVISNGGLDVFVGKTDPLGNTVWFCNLGGPTNESGYAISVDNKDNIYVSGEFEPDSDFDPGSGIYTIPGSAPVGIAKLKQCHTDTTLNISACSPYSFGCHDLFETGIYTYTRISAGGCDSMAILNLTINNSLTNLEANTCTNYTFGGNILDSSGLYYDTLINVLGCDSIVKLDLTVNAGVDVAVFQGSGSLSADASSSTYQWVTCPDYTIVPGETDQIFVPQQNGIYAVIITEQGDCTDTSSCYLVDDVGIKDINGLSGTKIYPNPVGNELNIVFGNNSSPVDITLTDMTGQVVLRQTSNGQTVKLQTVNLMAGVYCLRIQQGQNNSMTKIVKE